MNWRKGDTVLVRYLDRTGMPRGGRPLRIIGERNAYVVGWLPGNTIVATPVFPDGRVIRSVPPAERYRTFERRTKLAPWGGFGILMLIPRAAAHSIWLFWHDDGSFRGWYVNLEQTHTWEQGVITTRDHMLDIVCERSRSWQWKDEDDLAAWLEFGVVSAEEAADIRAEGERVARMIEAWEPPFSDGWEHWQPDPSWPTPELPEDWAA